MMKLILSLTLIWTLSSTAEALKCFVGGSDRSSQTCRAGEICATFATQGDGKETSAKCVPSSLFTVGNHTLSFNMSGVAMAATVHVCDKDDCNREDIPYPAVQKNNNLKCYTCDNKSPPVCNLTVQCEGVQDRCINGTVSSPEEAGPPLHAMGCASSNLCEAADRLEFFTAVKFLQPPTCCDGNLCDSAWSVKLNVITLLFGLFTLTFY